jgi:DNA-binding CsgD family transcriptional regulator
MFSESRLLRVIEDVYEAAADPAGLARMAQTLARAFETESALVALDEMPDGGSALPPTVALPSTTENFDAYACVSYAQHYHDVNIWLREGLKNALPAIVLCDELVDEATLERHEWHDYCVLTGMFHCLGTAFEIGENLMAEIGLHRRKAEARLVADDKRKMAQLLPHLRRALQLQRRFNLLERTSAIGFDVLCDLAVGVIVVDPKAHVLFANAIAERVLRAKAGITIADRMLAAHDVHRTGPLRKLVHEAALTSAGIGTSAGGAFSVTGANGVAMLLSIAPLRARSLAFGPSIPAAVITFSDPARAGVDDRALVQTYGLTRAEAHIACALAEGTTLADYAARQGIAVGTARTHLKHIFEKTGWRRQSDLVRALADPILSAQKQTKTT